MCFCVPALTNGLRAKPTLGFSVPRTSFSLSANGDEWRRIVTVAGLRTLNGRMLVSAEGDKLEAYPTTNTDKLEAYSTKQRDSSVVSLRQDCVNE